MDTFISGPAIPAVSIERHLRNKWTELLDVTADQVTADSNFFALGGNSMLVLSLHVFISAEFNIRTSVVDLLEHADFGCMVIWVGNKV